MGILSPKCRDFCPPLLSSPIRTVSQYNSNFLNRIVLVFTCGPHCSCGIYSRYNCNVVNTRMHPLWRVENFSFSFWIYFEAAQDFSITICTDTGENCQCNVYGEESSLMVSFHLNLIIHLLLSKKASLLHIFLKTQYICNMTKHVWTGQNTVLCLVWLVMYTSTIAKYWHSFQQAVLASQTLT